jgi:alpha-galactosidase
MLRFACLLIPAALWADVQPQVRINAGEIVLEFDRFLRSRVSLKGASAVTAWSASESVTTAGRVLRDFAFRKQSRRPVRDAIGSGRMFTVTGQRAGLRCPASPEVRRDAARFVTKAIKEWGFDGLKLDGQYMNAAPLCYNRAHHHASPLDSYEGAPGFFKAVYDAAIQAKPEALVEFCPCGTSYSFFMMPCMNMAVASDPRRSWQVRTKGKTLKALLGDEIAYFGDHVELSDEGSDFASSVGVGAVVGTEFTWPVGSGPVGRDGRRRGDLTPERQAHWAKWIALYKEKLLSKGEYLGELYDIGFDVPETHAIRKDQTMYYSFYAPEWKGTVELRGLSSRMYRVVDYEHNQDFGAIRGPKARLSISFSKHLLLEARPE